jgi:dimethylglycine catabolism A
MTPFPLLLSPFELRGRALRNRIASTPHATGWGGHAGRLDRSEVDYHVRKAAGGCGLVMTFGSASVDPTTAASYGSISLWDERNEPALRALADGVHAHGARCISQMTHMGRRGTSTLTGIPLRAPSTFRRVSTSRCPCRSPFRRSRRSWAGSRTRRHAWSGAAGTVAR